MYSEGCFNDGAIIIPWEGQISFFFFSFFHISTESEGIFLEITEQETTQRHPSTYQCLFFYTSFIMLGAF